MCVHGMSLVSNLNFCAHDPIWNILFKEFNYLLSVLDFVGNAFAYLLVTLVWISIFKC